MLFQPRRLAVITSLLVAGTTGASGASPELTYRTWTDSVGEKHAKAAVTDFDGKTVKLRKANGKLAIVKPADLSEADRAYLANWQRRAAVTPSARGGQSFPIVNGMFSQLKKATLGSAGKGQESSPGTPPMFPLLAAEPAVLPADLVHVRVSADYLRQRVERAIERQNAVNDVILGTQINGWATTVGRTGIKLEPSNDRALLNVTFAGTIRSRTVGSNGPAILHSYGETVFEARSRLTFENGGVRVTPATANARTNTTTSDIESTLPGLRGRIVERVAWRKSSEMRGQADHIAAQRASNRIAAALNQEMKQAAAGIEKALVENIRKLADEHDGKPSVHFRSTPEYLHLIMRRAGAADDDLEPPAVVGNPHISVRVHRMVVRNALSDTQLAGVLRPLMTGLITSKNTPQVLTADDADPGFDIQWSADRNWMMIDYRLDRKTPANLAKK